MLAKLKDRSQGPESLSCGTLLSACYIRIAASESRIP
jgi:hypothetical protein